MHSLLRSGGFLAVLAAALLWLASGDFSPVHAASRGLIVTGLSGSSANTEEFQRLALETKRLLGERGLPLANIEILDGNTGREAILKKLADSRSQLTPGDEFWLVLYGHSGKAAGGVPAFQIKGPRLTADDLKAALDPITARQIVLIGTSGSGAFLPLLQNERRTVIAATNGEGESDQPRYPDAWIAAFTENPQAAVPWIAARAAFLVDAQYKNSQLAQLEHARLTDPVTGKILEPPFGLDPAAVSGPPAGAIRPAAIAASSGDDGDKESPFHAGDLKVKLTDPNAMWEHQPPTAETKKLIAAAQAAPNPEHYPAVVLAQRLGLTVEDDRTTDQLSFARVYLAREDAVADWSNQFLPQSPPVVTSKLEVARVIHPDGSSVAFNPAKLPGATDPTSGTCCALTMVYLPDAHAGCVVEIGYRTRALLNASLPEVSESLPVQRGVPVLATEVEVRVPQKQIYHVALKNQLVAPVESSENGRRVLRWDIGPLAATEPMQDDPPRAAWTAWVGVSSLPSWDAFAAWYQRIAKGSDAPDPAVRKMALDLAAGAANRQEKLQRLYEFVSALRYVAVEIGVQGFRPRTPAQVLENRFGDCKDKANLLVAMLRAVDIDARFALVNRGGATDVNFPSWQFNHAVAFVPRPANAPNEGEWWLDSTDGMTPFGFIPPGDIGRDAFVFNEKTGKAEFKTIAGVGGNMSTLADLWDLRQEGTAPGGGWTGSFQRTATGLAEYQVRQGFRGMGPGQQKDGIYHLLAELWPNGDFKDPALSDVADMHQPAQLRARVSSDGARLPLAEFPWAGVFSAPGRDRPLWLNDGQPFTGTQTLRLHYAGALPATLPEPVKTEVAGQTLSIVWRRIDDQTAERVVRAEIQRPMVATADYAALRQALRQWSAAASADLAAR